MSRLDVTMPATRNSASAAAIKNFVVVSSHSAQKSLIGIRHEPSLINRRSRPERRQCAPGPRPWPITYRDACGWWSDNLWPILGHIRGPDQHDQVPAGPSAETSARLDHLAHSPPPGIRPARRTPGHTRAGTQISTAHP